MIFTYFLDLQGYQRQLNKYIVRLNLIEREILAIEKSHSPSQPFIIQ
jgi:hypothetical protein